MSLLLVVPDRPGDRPSGGDVYDAAVASALPRLGRTVEVARVRGGWPWAGPAHRARLARVLRGEGPVLVDGLVASAAPDEIETAAAHRPVVVLVHSVLSEGAGAAGKEAAELDRREARALHAAAGVVATSRFAADELECRYGLADVAVAEPGVDAAPMAAGSLARGGAPQLLALGALTPLKNHALLLDALATLTDLAWDLVVAGPAPDPDHLEHLRERATAAGLGERVRWAGPLVGDDLEQVRDATDLLAHPSRSETYGMVVAEAHARGIPTLVGAGTGAAHLVDRHPAPGAAVDTADPGPLARALRTWLTDSSLRRRWRDAALAARTGLPTWDDTARQVDEALSRSRV